MINVMLYSSIFAFYLSYYLYLFSTESKQDTELLKVITSIKELKYLEMFGHCV